VHAVEAEQIQYTNTWICVCTSLKIEFLLSLTFQFKKVFWGLDLPPPDTLHLDHHS